MTEIERKALALLNECAGHEIHSGSGWKTFDPNLTPCTRALCRAIEQHEAFKREVSDAVLMYSPESRNPALARFIIPKPDPLVEAWLEAFPGNHIDDAREECAKISTALAKHGLKLERIEHE